MVFHGRRNHIVPGMLARSRCRTARAWHVEPTSVSALGYRVVHAVTDCPAFGGRFAHGSGSRRRSACRASNPAHLGRSADDSANAGGPASSIEPRRLVADGQLWSRPRKSITGDRPACPSSERSSGRATPWASTRNAFPTVTPSPHDFVQRLLPYLTRIEVCSFSNSSSRRSGDSVKVETRSCSPRSRSRPSRARFVPRTTS